MATFNNGESGLSVRTKLNTIINKVEGVTSIDNDIDVTGTVTADGLTVDSGSTSVTATLASLGNGVTDTASIDIYRTNAGHNTVEIVDKRVADLDGGNLVIRTSDTDGTMKDRMLVGEGGNISFYEDQGTTPKFFWDAAAERLGLGTTTPEKPLHVNSDTGNIGIRVESTDATSSIEFLDSGTTSSLLSPRVGGISDDFFVQTSGAEAMRIDSSGNVGIGDSNPLSILHVGSGSDANVPITLAPASGGNVEFRNTSGTGSFTFTNNNGLSEKMRIDSSGNLLVGTTDADNQNNSAGSSADNGFAVNNVGHFNAARYNGIVQYLNRTGNDGDILEFRKDGTTVGSIGTSGGDVTLDGGSGHTGIRVGNSGIWPQYNGALDNGLNVDLGYASGRFRNAYLSGGVVFGDAGGSGTSTSNTLDSYEEGTWTPSISGSAGAPTITYTEQFGSYTKVGNKVTVWVKLKVATTSGGSGNAIISGLPFSFKNDPANFANSGGLVDLLDLDSRVVTFQGSSSGSSITLIQDGGTTTAHAGLGVVELNANTSIRFCFNYITA